MKKIVIQLLACIFCLIPLITFGQSNFSLDAYQTFLQDNQNLTPQQLAGIYPMQNSYYNDMTNVMNTTDVSFLDSVLLKYKLSNDEISLLNKNHLVVSERMNFNTFGHALHDIYIKDLPVFLTTDAVLHALHMSYDRILMDLEISILEPKLKDIVNKLYKAYPSLLAKYETNTDLQDALGDVDLYTTIALSLAEEMKFHTQSGYTGNFDEIWQAIEKEKKTVMPLFSERKRNLDFSQFTVRGHYSREFWDNSGRRTLGAYFKAMMWLGRIEFMLTPPPENPWELPWQWWEINRMDQGALLLNELIDMAGVRQDMDEMDSIIKFMVGESDNLTPNEIADAVKEHNITVTGLTDSLSWAALQNVLKSKAEYGQRILSNILLMDPYSPEPGELPVSFRLMGQRFIIDSYAFSNLVFDRIVYNGKKVWRPLPDPLDAMFVLGNDNALPLLEQELEQYKYSAQLASLRYLVDSYDPEFWDLSLYNVWLNALRQLNPDTDLSDYPLFMRTTAWQQLKLNTQLASWAQLRHDNLLYAKQSYTGGTGCSYPHSYIEPYPEFYHQIAAFAEKADNFFSQYEANSWYMQSIQNYFPRLKKVAGKLETIAQKELDGTVLNNEEIEYLKKMLFVDGGSGAPPFSGWYADMFYIREDAAEGDFVIADVHTQPTEENGADVGRVLHVAVGKIHLGVFITNSPSNNHQPTAFVGPVMSYYEKITENYDRMTDERWTELVEKDNVPARPDWVNMVIADQNGQKLTAGRTLPGKIYTSINNKDDVKPDNYELAQNVPNPFNPQTVISYTLPRSEFVTLTVYDILGRKVRVLVNSTQPAGRYSVRWNASNAPSGVYFYRLRAGSVDLVNKMLLTK